MCIVVLKVVHVYMYLFVCASTLYMYEQAIDLGTAVLSLLAHISRE